MGIHARYVGIILIALMLALGCGSSCDVSEDSLRGQWLQSVDVLGGGGEAEVIYEFSPPGLLRLVRRMGDAFPDAGYPFTIDDDLCEVSWHYIEEGPLQPRFRWTNIDLDDDQMVIDMVDPQLDSVLASSVVLKRIR